MTNLRFESLSPDEAQILLSAYGYYLSDDGTIMDCDLLEPIRSSATGRPLTLATAALVPGSLKIIDADPVVVAEYLREQIDSRP